MNATFRATVVAISCALLLLNTACTTLQLMTVDEGKGYAQQIRVGDKVRLLLLDEAAREIRVRAVDDKEITGEVIETGAIIVTAWEDVYAAERVVIAPVKTAAAGLGLAVAIPLLLLLALTACADDNYC